MLKVNLLSKDDRYQHQTWYIKLYRQRYMLYVPYYAIGYWWYENRRALRDEYDWRLNFKASWGLAKVMMHGAMKWYYYADELGHDFSKYVEDDAELTDTMNEKTIMNSLHE